MKKPCGCLDFTEKFSPIERIVRRELENLAIEFEDYAICASEHKRGVNRAAAYHDIARRIRTLIED